MAVRTFQLCFVFTIGFSLASATLPAVAKEQRTPIPLTLNLQDPEDVTVIRGQPATLYCRVSCKTACIIEWLYKNKPLPKNDSRWHTFKNGTLFIPKVAGKRMNNTLEGEYRCLVKNADGALLSNSAKLKIASIREFIEQPADISVIEFRPLVIPCSIISTPRSEIFWERDNLPLPQSTRYVPLSTGSLLITSINSSDVGSYRCKIVNDFLKKSKHSDSGQISVVPNDPDVVENPNILPLDIGLNVTVLIGDNVKLYCIVSGWPIPVVRWINDKNIVIGNSNILELRNVSIAATGTYKCSAYNSGDHVFQIYNVDVYQVPVFDDTPESYAYPLALTVRLVCRASGVPTPDIMWLKDGVPLKQIERIRIQPSELVLSHTVTTDDGIYQCVAVNAAGRIWAPALLKSNKSSSINPPINVRCRSYSDDSICMTWDDSLKNNSTIGYSVHSFYDGFHGNAYPTNETYKLVDALRPSTNYTFYIRKYSTYSASDQSKNVTCETGIRGDRNLIVQKNDATSIKMTWSELSNDAPCGKPNSYKIKWRRINEQFFAEQEIIGLSGVIKGLKPMTQYEFKLQPNANKRNTISTIFTLIPGNSTNSTFINETSAPDTPLNLEISAVSTRSVNLAWTDSTKDVYYSICYFLVDESEQDCEHLLKSMHTNIKIENLTPNKLYKFLVRTHKSAVLFSPFTKPLSIFTLSEVPSEVQELKYKILSSATACVSWEPPLYKNGKITNYLISYTPNNTWLLEKWFTINVTFPQEQNFTNLSCANGANNNKSVSILLEKLNPDYQYMLIVIASNKYGFGNPLKPITISTKDILIKKPEKSERETDAIDKRKLGVLLGLAISLVFILLCVGCVLLRQKCVKRRSIVRARLAAGNNYYPASSANSAVAGTLHVNRPRHCTADAHEMQHLVEENGTIANHIPDSDPAHIDTKGGIGFPNGQINGKIKNPYFNGHIPTTQVQVHITENPQFLANDNSNDYTKKNKTNNPQIVDQETYEEDSNSNLQNVSLSKILETKRHHIHQHESPQFNHKSYESPINHHKYDHNNIIIRNHDKYESSLDSTLDASLNSTQLTNLDDSLTVIIPNSFRKVSPALGPNG